MQKNTALFVMMLFDSSSIGISALTPVHAKVVKIKHTNAPITATASPHAMTTRLRECAVCS